MTDYFRIAACAPVVAPADVEANVASIAALAHRVYADCQPRLMVFPELAITGYTCADLLLSDTLQQAALRGLDALAAQLADVPAAIVVGAPLRPSPQAHLENCAVLVAAGRWQWIASKAFVPNYGEFYEARWFQASTRLTPVVVIDGVRVFAEICEDAWAPVPPSSLAAVDSDIDVAINLSASDDNVGKYDYLRQLLRQQSARCMCAYAYASAGWGESTTDLVFDPKTIICENGRELAENTRWQMDSQYVVADIDIAGLRHDRVRRNTFAAPHDVPCQQRPVIEVQLPTADTTKGSAPLLRTVDAMPFVPQGPALQQRCSEVFNIQVLGLARRLQATHTQSITVGISGGLDSTLALLVAAACFDRLGLPRTGIVGVTMPGFGTSDRTHDNAHTLMRTLGITIREIPIAAAVNQHFADIGHDPKVMDVTYENSQARERTQILMDIANQTRGMVLGTGDLSELALGWATYNGDHMSMYSVNASVPKTLVRHLVRWVASQQPDLTAVLTDIVDTPVSPELLPGQVTEDTVGPYELHDFFLYYMLRYGAEPRRVLRLALQAFDGKYDRATICRWMREFYRRFFQQQFKRSCLPDGPKTGSVCLSPRGDWRMPSDASAALWLKEVDSLS